MSPAAPASSPPRWRASIPIALGIFGIALSCSTACLTSAIVEDTRARAAEVQRNSEIMQRRQLLAQAIQPLLLPASAQKSATDRIHVTGIAPNYTVEVMGDYSESTAATLIARIGNLHTSIVEFDTDLIVHVYNDTGPARALVSAQIISPIIDLRRQLHDVLPPPIVAQSEDYRLHVTASGPRAYRIDARGFFTPESIQLFKDTLFKFCAANPRAPQFSVTLFGPADSPGYLKSVAEFDTVSSGKTGL